MIMNNRQYHQAAAKRAVSQQSGFSLLEVLIAVVILSVGLLGLAGMQVTSLKYVTSSLQRTQATSLAYDILDRLRANPSGNYGTVLNEKASAGRLASNSTACFGNGAGCGANQTALFDLSEWKTAIESLLPNGQGSVVVQLPGAGTTNREVTVTLEWEDRRDVQGAAAIARVLQLQMNSEI